MEGEQESSYLMLSQCTATVPIAYGTILDEAMGTLEDDNSQHSGEFM